LLSQILQIQLQYARHNYLQKKLTQDALVLLHNTTIYRYLRKPSLDLLKENITKASL